MAEGLGPDYMQTERGLEAVRKQEFPIAGFCLVFGERYPKAKGFDLVPGQSRTCVVSFPSSIRIELHTDSSYA